MFCYRVFTHFFYNDMNRIISILLAVAASLTSFAGGKVIIDGICYQLNDKKQTAVVVKNQQPCQGDIVIPEKVDGDSLSYYVEEISALPLPDRQPSPRSRCRRQ